MTKKQYLFWAIIALIIVGIVCFLKYNPLYATFETISAFVLGVFGEGIAKYVYDKWIK